jgi:nitrogen fixation protein NifU and related proteins
MDESTSLYREILLDHARHPRRSGTLDQPDLVGTAHNPLCGDQVRLTVALDGERIADIRGAVRGCVIAQAACSLMAELVAGKSLGEARTLGQAFREALEGSSDTLAPGLETLSPLLEVRRHRSRAGCALLAWEALAQAHKA